MGKYRRSTVLCVATQTNPRNPALEDATRSKEERKNQDASIAAGGFICPCCRFVLSLPPFRPHSRSSGRGLHLPALCTAAWGIRPSLDRVCISFFLFGFSSREPFRLHPCFSALVEPTTTAI